MTDEEAEVVYRLYQRLAEVETGLLGLVHFYQQYGIYLEKGPIYIREERWYYTALTMQAEMLFVAKRQGGDREPGAARRALRDLGLTAALAALDKALAAPATQTNESLRELIRRTRNEGQVHHSFDPEEDAGALLLFLGFPDSISAHAWTALMATVDDVLAEIHDLKLSITVDLALAHRALGFSQWVNGWADRARKKAGERFQGRKGGREAER